MTCMPFNFLLCVHYIDINMPPTNRQHYHCSTIFALKADSRCSHFLWCNSIGHNFRAMLEVWRKIFGGVFGVSSESFYFDKANSKRYEWWTRLDAFDGHIISMQRCLLNNVWLFAMGISLESKIDQREYVRAYVDMVMFVSRTQYLEHHFSNNKN